MSRHRSLRTAVAGPVLLALGCNPLAFENILEDAHVLTFDMQGPSGSVHSKHVLVFPPAVAGEPGFVSVGAERGAALAWLSLSAGGKAVAQIISKELSDGLAFPIGSSVDAEVRGLAAVPDPTNAGNPHGLVALLSEAEPFLSRIVRYRADNFARADGNDLDIVAPHINDVVVPGFASHMAAINLNASQDDPDYEVAVGSEKGVLVFDELGHRHAEYEMALDGLAMGSCVDESDCFFFTLCDSLTAINGITAAQLLDGTDPAFLVGTPDGITFIANPDTPATNLVGAPVFDCAADFRSAPDGASEQFGAQFLATDLDGDGSVDLAVGDPGANRVHIWQGAPGGLGDTPAAVLGPEGDPNVLEFGTGIGIAALGGNLGSLLIVGAPGTAVGGKGDVGAAFVYDPDVFAGPAAPVAILEDQNPKAGTRHGLWVGGLRMPGPDPRDELVILGRNEGRVHLKINPLDPRPGDAGQ